MAWGADMFELSTPVVYWVLTRTDDCSSKDEKAPTVYTPATASVNG